MLTEGDIANFLFTKAQSFGIANVWQWGNIPIGEVKTERVTVQMKPLQEDVYFLNGFAEINVLLPYVDQSETAPLIRMGEIEHLAHEIFPKSVEQVGEDWVRYRIDTLNRLRDEEMRCYCINVHLEVEVLNINN